MAGSWNCGIAGTVANFDIFLISGSKLDATSSHVQFQVNSFKLFRRDRNRFGAFLLFYLNENVPCKLLNSHRVAINNATIAIIIPNTY